METLGAMLRDARLAEGLDIAEVAQRIKVNPRYLEALEADDLSGLPGGFFYKSFVRQYAAALGVDSERVERGLGELQAARQEPGEERDDAALLKDIRPVAQPRSVRFPPIFNNMLSSVGVLILVIVACGAFSAWWNRLQTAPLISREGPREVSRLLPPDPEPKPAPTPSETALAPATADTAAGAAPADAPSRAAPSQETPAPPEQALASAGAAAGTGTGVRITITATQNCWIRVWTDGRRAYTGMLKPQESKTFDAAESARLRTGNAQGLTVIWNGKPVQLPGADAFVRDVSFTREAYEQTAKPPPAPEEPSPTG